MFYIRKKIKKQVKYCDWMLIAVFIFMILTRIMTISYFSEISEETGVSIEKVVTAYEASPVNAMLMNLRRFTAILLIFFIPAVCMSVYLVFRQLTLKGRISPKDLSYYSSLVFFIFLLNMVNDATYFLNGVLR